jgi:hypothetical protein
MTAYLWVQAIIWTLVCALGVYGLSMEYVDRWKTRFTLADAVGTKARFSRGDILMAIPALIFLAQVAWPAYLLAAR